ncbi:MAG: acyloxyacyl hydrolase [Bacillota bacterium]
MKRLLFIVFILIIAIDLTNAQQVYTYQEPSSNTGVGLQAGVAIPTGNFGDAASLGIGGEGTFEYRFTPQLGLDVSLGFYSWGSKNDLPPGYDFSIADIPLLVGARYLLMAGDFHPYAGAALGIHFLNTKTTTPLVGDESTNDTKFGFAPMAGIRLHMPPNLDLDLNLKYNIISDANYLTIVAGVLVAL